MIKDDYKTLEAAMTSYLTGHGSTANNTNILQRWYTIYPKFFFLNLRSTCSNTFEYDKKIGFSDTCNKIPVWVLDPWKDIRDRKLITRKTDDVSLSKN